MPKSVDFPTGCGKREKDIPCYDGGKTTHAQENDERDARQEEHIFDAVVCQEDPDGNTASKFDLASVSESISKYVSESCGKSAELP